MEEGGGGKTWNCPFSRNSPRLRAGANAGDDVICMHVSLAGRI